MKSKRKPATASSSSTRRKKKKPFRARTRLSKLHRRIRKELKLSKLGFRSERRIGRYRVDELNEKKKLIVEINGDHVHANPKQFKPRQRVKGMGYTADQKWKRDARRKKMLESQGYKVIVIWESDSLRRRLNQIKRWLKKR